MNQAMSAQLCGRYGSANFHSYCPGLPPSIDLLAGRSICVVFLCGKVHLGHVLSSERKRELLLLQDSGQLILLLQNKSAAYRHVDRA